MEQGSIVKCDLSPLTLLTIGVISPMLATWSNVIAYVQEDCDKHTATSTPGSCCDVVVIDI